MVSSTRRTAAARKQPNQRTWQVRALAALRRPITGGYLSLAWLALRLYLAWIWLQFSFDKFQSGWLTGDPIGALFKSIVGGNLRVPLPFYHDIASTLLEAGATPLLSHAMPFLELAVGLAFIAGVLVTPAAIGAILLNLNIILSGVGLLAFDGRLIALQALLILAGPAVSRIGVARMLARTLARSASCVSMPRSAAR